MDIQTMMAYLKSCTLFEELPYVILNEIAQALELESFTENSLIISQGDEGQKIYFLTQGKAKAYLYNKYGKEIIVAEFKKGNYFGELALLIDSPRTTFVKAKTACKLLSLSKKQLHYFMNVYPEISLAMNKVLSHRLSETLSILSDRKKNSIIWVKCTKEHQVDFENFIRYFTRIAEKPFKIIEFKNEADLFLELNSVENHYLFITTTLSPIADLIEKIDFQINFVEEISADFNVSPEYTALHLEHIARCIAHKTVGIALCSGGAPAISHLGVLNILQKNNIPLDYVVGTSAGALFGACFAFGFPYAMAIEKMMKETHKSFLLRMLLNPCWHFSGLINANYLKKIFTEFFGERDMSESLIPFAAVASDLYSGESVVLNQGSLIDALVASNAAPIIIEPIKYKNHFLIDGIATAPCPVFVLSQAHIDIKIVVPIPQLDLSVTTISNYPHFSTVYLRSRAMMAERMVRESQELGDVIVEPEVKGIKVNAWEKISEIIMKGEAAAELALKRINYLLYKTVQS